MMNTTGLNQSTIDQLNTILQPILILSLVVTIIFLILYTMHFIQKWRVNRAILEIRDTLRDMNAADQKPASPKPPSEDK